MDNLHKKSIAITKSKIIFIFSFAYDSSWNSRYSRNTLE